MDYSSIITDLEEQRRDEKQTTKLYRYTGLIQAIEFFSQKLNLDQIVEAAFDFVNELLTLEKSAVFVMQGSNYILKKVKGYESELRVIKNSSELQNHALLHGTILYDKAGAEKYFSPEVIVEYSVTAALPLIIDGSLYGFIFLSNKTAGEMNHDDFIISEALMRLINNALDNNKRYEDLQRSNRELDEKIFNLFAINQSSKALLSELNLDMLYHLSVDVFSELTQSSNTGFVLFDEKCEKFELKAFKDTLFSGHEPAISLTLDRMAVTDVNKVMIEVSNPKDVLYFNSLFKEGIAAIADLKSLYIVLLLKSGRIQGFVSLGRTMTGNEYKKSIFELIESLASSTYVALSNAQFFKQVNDQKKVIQNKLKKLISLNGLMKNISSSLKIETLLNLTLKALEASFEVEQGFMALYDSESKAFNITDVLNLNPDNRQIVPDSSWNKVFSGELVIEAGKEAIDKYVGKTFSEAVVDSDGIMIVPIYIDRVDIVMLGAIVIFKYGRVSLNDEENSLMVESIAGHIAPVMSNLLTIEEQKRFSLPNYIEMFKRDLKEDILQAQRQALGLEVIRVIDKRDLIFRGSSVIEGLKEIYDHVYPFTNNNIFIINTGEDKTGEKAKKLESLGNIECKKLVLGKDF